MIRFTFECDTQDDLDAVRNFFIGTIPEKKNTTNADRQKRYRDNKKRNESVTHNVTDRNETVTRYAKEERDEKEEVSPLIPSSLSSSPLESPIINPITPISPLPEVRAEREEKVLAPAAAKRGELRRFGPYVRLSDDELRKLEDKFGPQEVERMLQDMNNYIGEDPKRVRTYATRNHYLTLLNWRRMDEQRKQAKQIPKEQTFRDLRIKMEQEEAEKDNVIDSFWRV